MYFYVILTLFLAVSMKQPGCGTSPAVVLFNNQIPTEKEWLVASRRAIVFIVQVNNQLLIIYFKS